MARPAWCPMCRKAWSAESASEACPSCMTNTLATTQGLDAGLDDDRAARIQAAADLLRSSTDLTNTLAISVHPVIIPDPTIGPPRRNPLLDLPSEIECPRCAERIKARALVCRFCGHNFALEQAAREELERNEKIERAARGGARERARSKRLPLQVNHERAEVQTVDARFVLRLVIAAAMCALAVLASLEHGRRRAALREAIDKLDELRRER